MGISEIIRFGHELDDLPQLPLAQVFHLIPRPPGFKEIWYLLIIHY